MSENKYSSPRLYLGPDPSSQHSCHPVVIAGKLLVGEEPKLVTARRRQGHGRWQGFFLIALGRKAPFLAAVSTEEEKTFQALISALRDEGRINLNITQ